MATWSGAVLFAPIGSLVMFTAAATIARPLMRRIPDGRLKSILNTQMNHRGVLFELARMAITAVVMILMIGGIAKLYGAF